jgi:hypothetical protein
MARGYSSVGRALPLQGRRQRFESAYLQPSLSVLLGHIRIAVISIHKTKSINKGHMVET